MNGKDLKYLAAVADLARLDFEAASLTFTGSGGVLSSLYVAIYSGGWRKIADESIPNFQMSVSATKMRSIAALFRDDEPIKIVPLERGIRFQGQRSQVTVQEFGEPQDLLDVSLPSKDDIAFSLRMPIEKATDEFNAASAFVAENNLKQIFTGIWVESTGDGKALIKAWDGFSLLFTSDVSARTSGKGSVVVPAKDFLLGLALVTGASAGSDVTIAKTKSYETVFVYNKDKTAAFRVSIMVGSWPDLTPITDAPVIGSEISFSGEELRTLVASGRVFNSAEVMLEPDGRKVRVIVSGDEGGRFVMNLKGSLDSRVIYDLKHFDKLSRIGSRLDLTMPVMPEFPTIAVSEHRKSWLMSRG